MGQRIDQFCEDLRQKLTMTDSGLNGLKVKIDGKTSRVERDVQSHLERVQKRIDQERAKVAAAQLHMKKWAEQRKVNTSKRISEWKANREFCKLQSRVDEAERHAAAAIDMAVAAVDEAEQASLEAWLARRDADSSAQVATVS